MRNHTFVITLELNDKDQGLTSVRYSIDALDKNTALVRAGQRLARTLRNTEVVSVSIIGIDDAVHAVKFSIKK